MPGVVGNGTFNSRCETRTRKRRRAATPGQRWELRMVSLLVLVVVTILSVLWFLRPDCALPGGSRPGRQKF